MSTELSPTSPDFIRKPQLEIELWQRLQNLQILQHIEKSTSRWKQGLLRMTAVAGLGLLLLSACGGAEAMDTSMTTEFPYNFSECNKPPQNPDLFLNNDPVFRAASVPLFTGDQYWGVSSIGHGALIENDDGSLSITTVLHVSESSDHECLYAAVSGSGVIGALNPKEAHEWDRELWELIDQDNNTFLFVRDNIVSFDLTASHEKAVREAINRGEITPLHISNSDLGEIHTLAIPNPETGKVGYYEYLGNSGNKLIMQSEAGSVCQGRSGGPMLRVDDGMVTNAVVGFIYLVKATHEDDYYGNVRYCSNKEAFAINASR